MNFRGEYYFLSNMSPSPIIVSCEDLVKYSDDKLHDYIRKYLPNGFKFSCVEHGFQSLKTDNVYDFVKLLNTPNGFNIKKLGKTVHKRNKWSVYRDEVMSFLVGEKFKQNVSLQFKLAKITETIHHDINFKDYYWGRVSFDKKGQDKLGTILNKERKKYREEFICKQDNKNVKSVHGNFSLKDKSKQNVEDFIQSVRGSVFFIIDTETSGLDPRFWDVIEISAVKVDGDTFEIIDEFDTLVNPGYKLPNEIIEFNKRNETGIDDEALSIAPNPKEAAAAFKEFLGDKPDILGQNIQFDIGFLQKLYHKNLKKDFDFNKCVDTLVMAKEKIPGSHKLEVLYNLIPDAPKLSFHKSIDDVKATLSVFKWLIPQYGINLNPKMKRDTYELD